MQDLVHEKHALGAQLCTQTDALEACTAEGQALRAALMGGHGGHGGVGGHGGLGEGQGHNENSGEDLEYTDSSKI